MELDVLKDIKRKYGNDAMFRGDDEALDIEVRPSGSLLLDIALGGGYPKGRLISFKGAEHSGKTTLFNLVAAEAQVNEPNKEVAMIDTEQTYNPDWAEKLGVNTNKLLISQPDFCAEKIFEMIEDMLASKIFSIICLDSVAGLVPNDEFEQKDWMANNRVGGGSKLNTEAIRKLVNSGKLRHSGTTLIFINQLRDKIGGFSKFGTPTDTPGGRSLKHSYSQIVETSKGSTFKKGSGENASFMGQEIKLKVAKNKIAPPFKSATINLYYESGIDRITELVNVAKKLNVLEGSGWLRFIDPTTGEVFLNEDNSEIKFHGVPKTVEALLLDIDSGGELYSKMFDTVNRVLRG